MLIKALVSIVLCPFPVYKVETSSLEFPVDKSTSKASEDLLSLRVACGLSILGTVLLVRLCGL